MREIILKEISRVLQHVLQKDNKEPEDAAQIVLEPTKSKEHGDLYTNIALLLAKTLHRSPLDIAHEIVSKIEINSDIIDKILVAPPGFINFYVSTQYWRSILKNILSQKTAFGGASFGLGKKIMIEFVSANPTGPLHIGHGRCAALGDSLANLLMMVGYNVSKEYYINDTGRQIDLLGKSILARYNQIAGIETEFPDDGYKGDYITDIARMIFERDGKIYTSESSAETVQLFSKIASKQIMQQIREDLESFGVNFDSWFSEHSLFEQEKVSHMLSVLREKGFIYDKDGAQWMKASILGDQKDRVVIRSNGETTYFASDIAYHQNKYERGYEKIIDIWGADHHGYVDRIKAVLSALDHSELSLSILLVQMVKLIRNGVPVDMSTRKGTFTTLEEVIKEVGKDAARFFFLLRRHDSHVDFDIDLAKKQSAENPVYYCQYAYARICSIERQAKAKGISVDNDFSEDFALLRYEEEKDILKKLDLYPQIVKNAALTLEPHRITFYLIELSTVFHKYYNAHRVITADRMRTIARLHLIRALKVVLKSGLSILGISSPEKM